MAGKWRPMGEEFPILFENDRLRVYKNPSDEIFVEDKSGVSMRINSYPHLNGGIEFTHTGEYLEPVTPIPNMIGWRVVPHKIPNKTKS